MRIRTVAAVVSLACIVGSSQVRAQSTYGDDCSELDDTSPEMITACAKSLLNRQSLINTSTSITNVILDRFDMGPNRTEPAGLELSDPADVLKRLKSNGRITIAPTADVAAPAANPMWNIWIDGKYSWLDDTDAFTDLDGSLVNGVVGADYKVTDRLVFGLMGTYETSDLEGLSVTHDTDGWGGGAYLGLTLTDNLVLSATILGTDLDTDVNGGTSFDSARIQASSALTGYWYSGTWRYSPSVTVAWSNEWQDSSGALNQTIETGIISPGFQVGNSISIGGASTVEPWLGAQLDWVGINKTVDDVTGTILDDPYTDLRLQGGLNFAFGANAQLALTAEVSGLLYEDSDTYTAGANFAFQF
ncbi:MAG TPA: autotransporter outer membrane beta-barrel domain-containing protein [Aestuariivirga sp.]|nr:autotransporter outer membrane beta-barrel domain-containing protein [Aestuariivirga sp.]